MSRFKINKKIKIIKPQSYIDFANLLYNSNAVITDSGGVQKESFFFKKPCYILRQETEWNELVNLKYNYLINPQKKKFFKQINELNHKNKSIKFNGNFGNGNASEKIVQSIYNYLKNK